MILCLEENPSYLSATFKVRVYAKDEKACEDVRTLASLLRKQGFKALGEVRRFVEAHGGYRLVSRNPLVVETQDGLYKLEVIPLNALANSFANLAVSRLERGKLL